MKFDPKTYFLSILDNFIKIIRDESAVNEAVYAREVLRASIISSTLAALKPDNSYIALSGAKILGLFDENGNLRNIKSDNPNMVYLDQRMESVGLKMTSLNDLQKIVIDSALFMAELKTDEEFDISRRLGLLADAIAEDEDLHQQVKLVKQHTQISRVQVCAYLSECLEFEGTDYKLTELSLERLMNHCYCEEAFYTLDPITIPDKFDESHPKTSYNGNKNKIPDRILIEYQDDWLKAIVLDCSKMNHEQRNEQLARVELLSMRQAIYEISFNDDWKVGMQMQPRVLQSVRFFKSSTSLAAITSMARDFLCGEQTIRLPYYVCLLLEHIQKALEIDDEIKEPDHFHGAFLGAIKIIGGYQPDEANCEQENTFFLKLQEKYSVLHLPVLSCCMYPHLN